MQGDKYLFTLASLNALFDYNIHQFSRIIIDFDEKFKSRLIIKLNQLDF